ncbi:MAG: GNAT family N-acetyltransferase [Leptolyngbya sp. BL-A-14]
MPKLTDDIYINFRRLKSQDVEDLSSALLQSSVDYIRYFHPFDFDTSSIRCVLNNANKDKFFAIELISIATKLFSGFYMLRGFDEGYIDPMYGVFIAQPYTGQGIARLSLAHAECYCKIHKHKRLLLKVHPNNFRAKSLYESFGFQFMREDLISQNLVLYKDL